MYPGPEKPCLEKEATAGRAPGASRRACQSTARSARGAFSGRRGAQHMQSEPSSAMEARPPRLPHVRATKGRRPGPWGFSATPGCAPSRRWRRGRAPAARRGWPAGEWRRGSRRMSSRRGGGEADWLAGLRVWWRRRLQEKSKKQAPASSYSCRSTAVLVLKLVFDLLNLVLVLYCAAPPLSFRILNWRTSCRASYMLQLYLF